MTKASQARTARRRSKVTTNNQTGGITAAEVNGAEVPSPVKARRKPGPKARATGGESPDPQLTAEQQVTILSQQIGFLRNQYFLLAQRYGGNAVAAQTMTWEGATNFINGEMQNLDVALNQIAASAQQ